MILTIEFENGEFDLEVLNEDAIKTIFDFEHCEGRHTQEIANQWLALATSESITDLIKGSAYKTIQDYIRRKVTDYSKLCDFVKALKIEDKIKAQYDGKDFGSIVTYEQSQKPSPEWTSIRALSWVDDNSINKVLSNTEFKTFDDCLKASIHSREDFIEFVDMWSLDEELFNEYHDFLVEAYREHPNLQPNEDE